VNPGRRGGETSSVRRCKADVVNRVCSPLAFSSGCPRVLPSPDRVTNRCIGRITCTANQGKLRYIEMVCFVAAILCVKGCAGGAELGHLSLCSSDFIPSHRVGAVRRLTDHCYL